MLNQLAVLLCTVDRLRNVAGAPNTEYGVEIMSETFGNQLANVQFVQGHAATRDAWHFEPGVTKLPRYSYGPTEERLPLMKLIMQDMLHSVGCSYLFDWKLEITET